MEIKINHDLISLDKAFTEYFKEIVKRKSHVAVALSGGSTPKSLFVYWAQNHREDIPWRDIRFFWGDERCVPPADVQSNYKMAKDSLLDFVPVPKENIFRIEGENNPLEEAKRYACVLKNELEIENNLPVFDLIMLGMGDDGHTASIFPHEIDLWDSPDWCVVATHPESGQKRVSLSGSVINNARNVAFLVTGSSKAKKIEEIIGSHQTSKELYPAARINPVSGSLTWFVDEEAVKFL